MSADLTELKQLYTSPRGTAYSFYLFEIGDPQEYMDWFHVIRQATQNDTIELHINSGGGRLDTTLQLIRALSDTQAQVICSVEGACMSAATIIFLQGDILEISPYSEFMFHNYSSGAVGKGGEMYDRISFEKKSMKHMMKDAYEDILTKKEFSKMLDGKDIYKSAEEMLDILEIRAEKQAKIQEKEEKEQAKLQKKLMKVLEEKPKKKKKCSEMTDDEFIELLDESNTVTP